MANDEKYQQVHFHEGIGASHPVGSLGMKILINDFGVLLTEKQQELIFKKAEDLYKELLLDRAREGPEGRQEKEQWIKNLLSCFPEAFLFEILPNQYCSNACCVNRPWLNVLTTRGHIVIGPRTRVLSISWEGTKYITKTAQQIFPDEDTTKDGKVIHAWGLEKAKEYIHKLLED